MEANKYHYAAFAYIGSALLTILSTLFLGGPPERFRVESAYLLIGLPLIFVCGQNDFEMLIPESRYCGTGIPAPPPWPRVGSI